MRFKRRSNSPLKKRARHDFRGYPVATVAFYGPDDQRRIFEDFSQDLVLYARWPHLQTLIVVVYNSADLRDPEALEKLSGKH